MNTIKNGVENSRQGGPFFKDSKGNLFRVSQNAANVYGFGYNIHKIIDLTEKSFEEEDVFSFKPSEDGIIGAHSFNNVEGLQVYDVLRRIRKKY
ncbi:hypothetical protein N9H78_00815 [Winogradskyella sp.]|nr:hypothetical protein [Winogradskyella sp.]MDA8874196.1 hypothetical protein [Winogradskyella sp.]